MYCYCCHIYVAAATATSAAEVKNISTSDGLETLFEGGGLLQIECEKKKTVGFPMLPTRLGEEESNMSLTRARSATLNAPSTTTELGRDPAKRCKVPTGILLAQQPKVLEPILGRRRAARQKNTHLIYTFISLVMLVLTVCT